MDTVTVVGAGKTEVNGDYNVNGSQGGAPKFTFGVYEISYVSGRWNLLDSTRIYYYASGDTSGPPSGGWELDPTWGISPAPSISGGSAVSVSSNKGFFLFF